MGLFIEVYTKCPSCESMAVMQISEIIPGMPRYWLTDIERISNEMTIEQVKQFKKEVLNEKYFTCSHCEHYFTPFKDTDKEEKKNILQSLLNQIEKK